MDDRKVAEFDVAASLPFCADMSCCQRPFDDNVMPTIHATETVDEDDDNDDDGVEGSDDDDDVDDKYDDYNDADAQQSLVDEYHVDLTDLLQAAKFGDVSTSIQLSTNRAIDELLVDIDNVKCYCNLQLYRLSMMYDVARGSQTELTAFYQKVHEYFCRSQFQRELHALINCATISEGQGHAAYRISSAIRCSFLQSKVSTPPDASVAVPLEEEVSAAGRVCWYVGAYCVAKVKYRLTSNLRRLVSSPNPLHQETVRRAQCQLDLLDSIIRSEAQIAGQSTDITSTRVISQRQNATSSLTHVTDESMQFFEQLTSNIDSKRTVAARLRVTHVHCIFETVLERHVLV